MGLGHFTPPALPGQPAELDLVVSFRYNATDVQKNDWRNLLEWASNMLFEATEGQVRLGKIVYGNNLAAEKAADIWLHDTSITASAHSGGVGLGAWEVHIELGLDTLGQPGAPPQAGKPGQAVHELGHHALGLGEEYDPHCMPDLATAEAAGACIMQYGSRSIERNLDGSASWSPFAPPITEFCHGNHETAGVTHQSLINNGQSCAETVVYSNVAAMTPRYPGAAPFADPPVPASTAAVPAKHSIGWLELDRQARFALVLDVSASMQARRAIDGVKYGADFWVDLEVLLGSQLAIVSYATTAAPVFGLAPVTQVAATAIHTSIGNLAATGFSTNIRAGLQAGEAQVTPAGAPAADQIVILFSDGRHNEGPWLTDTQLANLDAPVYTLGFGNADQALLQNVATQTMGEFEMIDDPGDQPDAHLEIVTVLCAIAAKAHSGLVSFRRAVLPAPIRLWQLLRRTLLRRGALAGRDPSLPRYSGPDLAAVGAINLRSWASPSGFDLPSPIEEGSVRATFVMTHRAETAVDLYLFRPNGQIVGPGDPDVDIVAPPGMPYAFYVITLPAPGVWRMRAVRGQPDGSLHVTMFAFSENPHITVGLTGTSRVYAVDEPVRLNAQISNRFQLTGVSAGLTRPRRADRSSPLCRWLSRFAVVRWLLRIWRWLQRLLGIGRRPPQPFTEERVGKGWYGLTLPGFPSPGSYDFIAEFASDGSATQALDEGLADQAGIPLPVPYQPPEFRRLKRFQIHVGDPGLPIGEDTD